MFTQATGTNEMYITGLHYHLHFSPTQLEYLKFPKNMYISRLSLNPALISQKKDTLLIHFRINPLFLEPC